jgi:hypothetical protein
MLFAAPSSSSQLTATSAPARGAMQCDRPSDPLLRAGDQNDFPRQIHCDLPSLPSARPIFRLLTPEGAQLQ